MNKPWFIYFSVFHVKKEGSSFEVGKYQLERNQRPYTSEKATLFLEKVFVNTLILEKVFVNTLIKIWNKN